MTLPSLPSDVQRAPSDRLIYGQSFEMPVDEDIAKLVAARAAPTVHVYRKGLGWIAKGSAADTGAKQYMHANTTCVRFQVACVTDLPPTHPLKYQAFRLTGWLVDGKPLEGNIKAAMKRIEAVMTVDPMTVVMPSPLWPVDPDGRGWSVMEVEQLRARQRTLGTTYEVPTTTEKVA